MFFAAYTAPSQELTGNLAGTNRAPRAALTASGEVMLLGRAGAPSMTMTEGAQLLARMTSRPRARFGAASVLFGTAPTPTALLQVDNHLKATAPSPKAFLWSGALLRVEGAPVAMPMSEAPASSAALLYGSAPTAALTTQSTYQLNGTADLKDAGFSGLLAANNADVLRGRALLPHMSMQQEIVVQNYVGLMIGATIQALSKGTVVWALRDVLNVSDVPIGNGTYVLSDQLQMSDASQIFLNALMSLEDGFTAADFIDSLLQAFIADRVNLSQAPTAWLSIGLQLASALSASDQIGWQLDSHVAVALSFALRDVIFDAQGQYLSSGLSASSTVIATAEHITTLLASFTASATATNGAILYAFLADSTNLSDTPNVYAQVLQALEDGAQLGLTLYTGQDTYTAWVMTPETRAMRRYLNYPFNSYAQIGNALYGAGAGGIYELSGSTDAGTSIYASLRTGLLDFGSRQMKRIDRLYLGYASSGTLCLRLCTTSPEGEKVEYTYKMVQVTADAPREQRIGTGRGIRSVYWQFELDNNADGSDFELSDITVLPMLLTRRV